MTQYLPGESAVMVFENIRKNFGVRLSALAAYCGIPKQHISDMRTGRRRFTSKMAERIIAACPDEPWIDIFKTMFTGVDNEDGDLTAAMNIVNKSALPFRRKESPELPLLTALVTGDPEAAPNFTGRRCRLPEAASDLIRLGKNPYVLIMPCDDSEKRLRAGDQVLILQTVELDKEIMVVERGEALYLARSARYSRLLGLATPTHAKDDAWLSLNSGEILPESLPVACVAGVVWAAM